MSEGTKRFPDALRAAYSSRYWLDAFNQSHNTMRYPEKSIKYMLNV